MKKFLRYLLVFIYCVLMGACHLFEARNTGAAVAETDSVVSTDSATAKEDTAVRTDSVPLTTFSKPHINKNDPGLLPPAQTVNTKNILPDTVVRFAKTLTGTRYVYASANPNTGFDCSGFITYVFNHFGIAVPRSSIDFTNVGKTVSAIEAKPGDLILFTGTDSTATAVGHMGLIVSNDVGGLQFIHSSSGKAMGVTITALNDYYKKRFVRIARIFPENDAATITDANTFYLPAPGGADSTRTVRHSATRYHRNKTINTKHQSGTGRRRRK